MMTICIQQKHTTTMIYNTTQIVYNLYSLLHIDVPVQVYIVFVHIIMLIIPLATIQYSLYTFIYIECRAGMCAIYDVRLNVCICAAKPYKREKKSSQYNKYIHHKHQAYIRYSELNVNE